MRLFAATTLLAACAAAHKPVHPEEMSAAAHRREAAFERSRADAWLARHEPPAAAMAPGIQGTDPSITVLELRGPYNPALRHVTAAERHALHALEHERAAAALEAAEEEACRDVPGPARAACPTLGPVVALEPLDDGVRFVLPEGAPVAALLARMRCHLAYARTRGFPASSECPLYVRGVALRAGSDGRSIEVVSHDADVARTIKARAAARRVR